MKHIPGPRSRGASLVVAHLLSTAVGATDLEVRVADASGAPLSQAVVALYPAHAAPPPATQWTMDQVNKQFVPRMLAIHVGDRVAFPNSDDIRHHVYSFSPARSFELPLYHGIPAEPVSFDRAGKVVLGCNIHDRMSAHIYVLDADLFAVTEEGRHRFAGLAPGDYEIALFHPGLAPAQDGQRQPLRLGAGPTQAVTLVANPQAAPAPPDDAQLTPLERKFRALRREAR